MKKQVIYIFTAVFIASMIFTPFSLASNCSAFDKKMTADHTSDVDGYHLEYQFIDMKEKMKEMGKMNAMPPGMAQQMKDMTATHHLMVSIKNSQGDPIMGGMVGYLIEGPDGKDQKAMAMGMGDSYGANVDLSQPGEYTIKTKALVGEKKIVDSFTYTVK